MGRFRSGERAFQGCESLEKADIPQGITFIEDSVFSGCKKLESLDLSDFDTLNVIMMYDTLSHCDRLKTVDISGFDTENVVSMKNLFIGCPKLSKIVFGKNFRFLGKFKSSYLPKPSGNMYTGKWIRKDGKYGPYKNKQLIKSVINAADR